MRTSHSLRLFCILFLTFSLADCGSGSGSGAGEGGGSITVTYPNGGEIWNNGSRYTIRWDALGSTGSSVRIELYESLFHDQDIAGSTANDGTHIVTVPSDTAESSWYKLRILSTTNDSYSDYSDEFFTIAPAGTETVTETEPQANSITVTSPNGGEIWEPGSTQTIA